MFGLGQWELLVIFLVVLLLFGARRIPEMAQGLGKGIKEFRKAVRDVQEEVDVSPTSADTGPSIGGTVANQAPAKESGGLLGRTGVGSWPPVLCGCAIGSAPASPPAPGTHGASSPSAPPAAAALVALAAWLASSSSWYESVQRATKTLSGMWFVA